MTKKIGHPYNKRNSWAIIVVETKKIFEKFRTKATAMAFLPKWKKITKEKLEIIKL